VPAALKAHKGNTFKLTLSTAFFYLAFLAYTGNPFLLATAGTSTY